MCGINHDQTAVKLGSKLILTKAMDISLSPESVIKQVAAIQNEFKQPNEVVSKIEQKTSTRNQSAKCFRCDNLDNPKSCPFIDKEWFFVVFFSKIRDTHRKFAEKKPIHRYPSNILPTQFRKLS